MSWRGDEKRARELAPSDPSAALQAIDRAIAGALESSLVGVEQLCDLLALNAEIAEAAGDPAAAVRARGRIETVARAGLAGQDRTLERSIGTTKIAGALEAKARLMDRIGETTEADRLRLAAADVSLAAVGDPGAAAAVAAMPYARAVQTGTGTGSGQAFQRGWELNYRAPAEQLRDPLIAEGRAVALARCGRCGDVVEADWKQRRCTKNHRVEDVRVVLAEDAPALRAKLGVLIPDE